ncbi:shoot gravitropism 2 (SGR2) [Artemisia annua]|uniref:Shoot gravitropism 2 (SGR2) n=1 Tax=Artemisia annua TaxID=35608 RepID=A0A2U1PTB9_ARTAN|nr:shoot gravitropism 2 (SGR2) [Artemisia annua]
MVAFCEIVSFVPNVWHCRTFQPSRLFVALVDMQGSAPGLHAIFMGEDDTWDAWLKILSSGFSGTVHFRGSGIKLMRGYAPSQSPKPTHQDPSPSSNHHLGTQLDWKETAPHHIP